MTNIRTAALLLAGGGLLVVAAPIPCIGQDKFSDSTLSREQWTQRVEDARRHSQEFVARARSGTAVPSAPFDAETEAADRALNDPTLRQGDIVATGKGFVVFVGREERHQPGDFVAAPGARAPQ